MNARSWIRAAVLASLLFTSSAFAVQPADTIFPDTTTGFVSIPDVNRLSEQWNKTQLGQLMLDPVMKPFIDDLKAQLRENWSRRLDRIGLTADDLEGVPGGEVAVGLIRAAKDQAALALVVDITGHQKETDALLEKIDRNLVRQKATRSTRDVAGTRLSIYALQPAEGDGRSRRAVFFVRDNMLCAADHVGVAEAMVLRFKGAATDSLSKHVPYHGVMDRATSASRESLAAKVPTGEDGAAPEGAADSESAPADAPAGGAQGAANQRVPELRWYIEPFDYIEASRLADPNYKKKKGKDMAKILAGQGFDAIRGIGGYVHLFVHGFDVLHCTFIYAPPVNDVPPAERYRLAARMLRFPNGGDLMPQAWVPRELASYISFNLEIRPAFEYAKTLVDAIVGEEVFDDVIDGLINDPDGPQIDIRKDLLAHLGTRCTVISDFELPITPKSERIIVAIEATDAKALAATIDKTMEKDQDAHRREFEGHTIWEIIDEEADVPMIQVERPNLNPLQGGDEQPPERRRIPNAALCVVNGQLYAATHIDFLKKVLVTLEPREQLGRSGEFRLVMQQLDAIAPGHGSFRLFSRTEDEYRPTYELIRTGQMPESKTVLGKILNSFLGSGKEGEVRAQKIDGRNLPDFEAVRRYFGPAGTTIVTEDNGWFIEGILLSKEGPQAVAAREVPMP